MKRIIGMEAPEELELLPKTTTDEIVQNITFITGTVKGTCPMCREIGIDNGAMGERDMKARTMLTRDVFLAMQDLEPRATLQNVRFESIEGETHTAVMEVEIDG